MSGAGGLCPTLESYSRLGNSGSGVSPLVGVFARLCGGSIPHQNTIQNLEMQRKLSNLNVENILQVAAGFAHATEAVPYQFVNSRPFLTLPFTFNCPLPAKSL
ncbi:hypothetical protein RhiXN_02360 [Rhizoctonia solani]|uniref:Uncharacterized protein n=1 Tax=Rhizoctonia solani TaxID=456999 RepID=A0A8H8PAX2_9AGAM|nr:uncharacterized protein RhiXN_02360 [Rhizoctonia solani]QRW27765.1 hypothetical protein RhiXN_02360 [Rhizoctonia solani]